MQGSKTAECENYEVCINIKLNCKKESNMRKPMEILGVKQLIPSAIWHASRQLVLSDHSRNGGIRDQ